MIRTFLHAILATCVCASDPWAHTWETAGSMLWADFFARTPSPLSSDQLAFIASHYGIVSLEKCWTAGGFTANELAIPTVASALRALNPAIRILYYFHSSVSFGGCYLSCSDFESHPQCELLPFFYHTCDCLNIRHCTLSSLCHFRVPAQRYGPSLPE